MMKTLDLPLRLPRLIDAANANPGRVRVEQPGATTYIPRACLSLIPRYFP